MAIKAPNQHEAALDEPADAPETDAGPTRVGKAARGDSERRCIVTGVRGAPAGMIRFALSPDGVVTPDIAGRLPGRGAWVSANRAAVDKAVKSGAFSRAFRAQANAEAGLADQVCDLISARLLDHLGIGRRAGDVLCGFDVVRDALKTVGCACLIEASDGAEDGRAKTVQIVRARVNADRAQSGGEACVLPALAGCFTAEQLGMALGRERVVHACVNPGRFAQSWVEDLGRLAGFTPVWPDQWPGLDTDPMRADTSPDEVSRDGRRPSLDGNVAPDEVSPEGED